MPELRRRDALLRTVRREPRQRVHDAARMGVPVRLRAVRSDRSPETACVTARGPASARAVSPDSSGQNLIILFVPPVVRTYLILFGELHGPRTSRFGAYVL